MVKKIEDKLLELFIRLKAAFCGVTIVGWQIMRRVGKEKH